MRKIFTKNQAFWVIVISIIVVVFLILADIGNPYITSGLLAGLIVSFLTKSLDWVTK